MFYRFVFRSQSVKLSVFGASAPKLLALLFFLLWSFTLAGCGPSKPQIQTVKIGLVAPFEGPGYDEGYRILSAVKLAVREWNSKRGSEGYRVELVAYDERDEGLEAKKLAIDPQVMGVLGHLTSDSFLAGAPHYGEAGLAVILLGAFPDPPEADKDLTSRGVIAVTPSEGSIGRATAHFLEELGKQKPAVISGPTRHDRKVAEAFLREAAGMDVVLNLSLAEEGRYVELLPLLKLARPDAVFFVGPPNIAAALWEEAQKKGVPLLFTSQKAPRDFLRIADPRTEAVYYVGTFPPSHDSPPWARFSDAYQAAGGGSPSPWAALAYDEANLLLEAIKISVAQEGIPSRAGVLRALEGMKEYSGVTGTIALHEGDREPRVYFYSLEGQSFPRDAKWAWPP